MSDKKPCPWHAVLVRRVDAAGHETWTCGACLHVVVPQAKKRGR